MSEKQILVVDDQSAIRFIIKQMLKQMGHTPYLAESGAKALQILETHNEIDLVISDIQMDSLGGMDLLKTCKVQYPKLPVVLMSAYTKDDMIIKALRLGASDYLLKPFEIEQLAMVINRVQELYSDRRKAQNFQDYVHSFELDLRFTSRKLNLDKLQKLIKNSVQNYSHMQTNDMMNFSIVLEESLLNAHEHGNLQLDSAWKEEYPGSGSLTLFDIMKKERLANPEFSEKQIKLHLLIDATEIQFSVEDEGEGFQPGAIAEEASGKPYGMGLMLINNLMDKISFNKTGTKITVVKYL